MFTDDFDNFDKVSATDSRRSLPRFQGEHLVNNQHLTRALKECADGKSITTAQLALAWVLGKGQNIIPIPGTKKRKYLEQNAKAVDITLGKDEIIEIESIITKFPNTGERYGEAALKMVNN